MRPGMDTGSFAVFGKITANLPSADFRLRSRAPADLQAPIDSVSVRVDSAMSGHIPHFVR